MNWIKVLMGFYCHFNGFKIKSLTEKQDLKAAFDLKNRVNQSLSNLKPLPEEEDFIYPKGVAVIIGVYKHNQLIGTIQLMDLTRTISYSSKIFGKANLDYNPQTTYEVKSFVVDNEYQHGVGGVFNVLIFYAIHFTEKMKKDKWLVVTSDIFYEKIKKRSGLPTSLIAHDYSYVQDETSQSRYFLNYVEQDHLKDCTCYYIHIPKGLLVKLTIKFFRMSFTKSLNKLRRLTTLPELNISTIQQKDLPKTTE